MLGKELIVQKKIQKCDVSEGVGGGGGQ